MRTLTGFALAFVCCLLAKTAGGEDSRPAPLKPLPTAAAAPEDNPTTAEKVALGKLLFFDTRLSGDNQMSCATCHVPDKGFADGLPTGRGKEGRSLPRNTPSVLNTGFLKPLFWDGRAATLEQQALEPLRSSVEMQQDLDELERELNAVPDYAARFQEVFQTPATRQGVARALAAYQRSLVTRDSPFDRYLAGDRQALSPAARHGLELFQGEAGCIRCHNGPLLSDGKFYRLGVSYRDPGRAAVTNKPEDRFKFRVPPLRNVAQTAPYMHDGSLKTLDDVVTFYFRGVSQSPPDGLSLDIEPLSAQSFSDIADIVAFLRSLSGSLPGK